MYGTNERRFIFQKKDSRVLLHPRVPIEEIQRHYGIDHVVLTNSEIFEFRKQLNSTMTISFAIVVHRETLIGVFILRESSSDIQFPFPPLEWDLLGITNLESFQSYLRGQPFPLDPLLINGNEALTRNLFRPRLEKIDTRNYHYILGKQLRFKRYTRFTVGQARELFLGRFLAEAGMFPKILGSVSLDWRKTFFDYRPDFDISPLGIFVEELPEAENFDSITGLFYIDILKSETNRNIGSIDALKSIIIELFSFLEEFESFLQKIVDPDLLKYFGDRETGGKAWIREFKVKFERLREKGYSFAAFPTIIFVPQLIHGDCWLRQFIRSGSRTFLLDLEDSGWGSVLFDFASLYNSLEEQNDYFRVIIAKTDYEREFLDKVNLGIREVLEEVLKNRDLKEFKTCRILRLIHELDYLVRFQPYLKWQINIIAGRLGRELNQLED
ncbi:MAG TPA: phosphotransferase [Candidatus Hodarchaeales archaeon]|nr:phosphotransferase [Candidatus Hodarchaeales archaeon]